MHAYACVLQVSEQAVQMAWDGLFDEARAGGTHALPTTRYADLYIPRITARRFMLPCITHLLTHVRARPRT